MLFLPRDDLHKRGLRRDVARYLYLARHTPVLCRNG